MLEITVKRILEIGANSVNHRNRVIHRYVCRYLKTENYICEILIDPPCLRYFETPKPLVRPPTNFTQEI